MNKRITIAIAACAVAIPAGASAHTQRPYLSISTARAIAVGRVNANWNPPRWSDGYGYAWDHVKANCLR
jgi:hypothetical protein